MDSKIRKALELRHEPVATLWTDEEPPKALRFKEGRWNCVMFGFAAAAKGRPAAFDVSTYGCWGGGVGLGFGNAYEQFPGGVESFCRFLSTGNAADDQGRAVGEQIAPHVPAEFLDEFMEGERYAASPEVVRGFIDNLPITNVPSRYVVLAPLSMIERDRQEPVVVTFAVDPDQLSALVVLANYESPAGDRVIAPFAAGCQQMGVLAYREADAERPRAVIGLTDLSARLALRRPLGGDLLSLSVPLALFDEMEANVEGSFFDRPTWRALRGD